jgi:hypothetical protein
MEEHCVDRVDFLKMDCEGSEWPILEETPPEVLSRIDALAMELHCNEMAGRTPERMVARLATFFASVRVDRRGAPALCTVFASGSRRTT